jgi:hypothetical protein
MLPIVVYALKRRYPKSVWRYAHVPLLLGGLNYLPPASATNYGSWAVVGLVSGVYIKHVYNAWWKRYTFVLSAALDSSIAIAAVIIFFAMFWTKASDHFTWWGTTVYKVSRVRPGLDPKTNSYEGDLRLEVLPLQNSNEGTDIWFLMRTASTL